MPAEEERGRSRDRHDSANRVGADAHLAGVPEGVDPESVGQVIARVGPDAGPAAGPDAGPDAAPAAGPDAGPGAAPDAEPGVGPWPGGPQAWPALDVDGAQRYDPDLLAHGDRRNVADQYRYWTLAAIVADLDTRRSALHVAIENWGHDLNIGSIVRTANAFNVAGVHVVGRRRWNRRGAMVTDRYVHVHHHDDVAHLLRWAAEQALPVLGVDNVPGSVPIERYRFPRSCVLLFGQEGPGLTSSALAGCRDVLAITQYGSTRSINAGAAAAIAMYAWGLAHAPEMTRSARPAADADVPE